MVRLWGGRQRESARDFRTLYAPRALTRVLGVFLCLGNSLELKEISGGAEGTRTPGPLNAIQVLFQLSYSPTAFILQSVPQIR